MNKTLKVGLIFFGAVLAVGGIYVYRRKRTPDDLTIEVSNVDNDKKSFDAIVQRNGKFWSSLAVTYRPDLIKKGDAGGFEDGKNRVSIYYDDNSVEITGSSLGQEKFKKIVKFESKEKTAPEKPKVSGRAISKESKK